MTTTALTDFTKRLDQTAEDTEALLGRLLSDALLPDEIARPKRLMDAMRYSSLNGGKRLRPFLVVESSAVFGVPRQAALLAGAALECIHCYSLVHDDLPAMDNSDLRRGRPTLHKKTDDATAILAGDGLLTLAFDIITRDEIHKDPTVRLLLTRALARASGIGGMVGGQMLDLAGEGRFGDREPVDVARLQQMKTGALLRFGCIAGAILGQSSPKEYQALDDYGRALGEAFQIADDLLDVEGDAAALGKKTGQDAALGKTTFVTQLGIDGAKQRVRDLLGTAPIPRSRSSAPRATCCAPPRDLSPNARIERRRWRTRKPTTAVLSASGKCPSRSAWSMRGRAPSSRWRSGSRRSSCCRASLRLVTRLLIAWDIFVALYLLLVYTMMFRSGLRAYPAQRGAAGRRPLSDPGGDRARRVRQHRRDRVRTRRHPSQRAGADAGDRAPSRCPGPRCTPPSRCITPMIITAAPNPAACSFRAATRMTTPTIGILCISRS